MAAFLRVRGNVTHHQAGLRIYRELTSLPDQEKITLEDLCADILAPIRINGRLLAVVSLGPKKSGKVYSKTELSLLQMLGDSY